MISNFKKNSKMYASHNFQQELSTYNYGHTFRKLAVSKHVRINGNETSD